MDEAIPLRCEPELSLLESFERTGDDKLRDEEVQLSWFVRNGSLDESVTFWSREAKEPEKAFENEVTADEAGESTVWCVIRDGRGGSDWRRFDLVIE